MVARVKGDVFKRGISEKFVDALRSLAGKESWWRDVVYDSSLIIGVRDRYLNVYWQGQSIFRISMSGETIVASTHPKYLIDPGLQAPIKFNGESFAIEALKANAFIHRYE